MSQADYDLVNKKRQWYESIYKQQLTIKKTLRRVDLPQIKKRLTNLNRWCVELKKSF